MTLRLAVILLCKQARNVLNSEWIEMVRMLPRVFKYFII